MPSLVPLAMAMVLVYMTAPLLRDFARFLHDVMKDGRVSLLETLALMVYALALLPVVVVLMGSAVVLLIESHA